MTPGRRSLIAVLQRTLAREVAARCGVAPSRVSEWLSGTTTPSVAARVRLRDIYGISVDSWDVDCRVFRAREAKPLT